MTVTTQTRVRVDKNLVYSPYKLVHHQEKIRAVQQGKLPFPVFCQVDLSNRCNLHCDFCFYIGDLRYPLDDWDATALIATDVMKATLQELHEIGVQTIEWTGGGSVECHPDYKELFLYAKQLGFGQSLVTNGTLLDDEAVDIIKDFDWVRFSIDACTPFTYADIKGKDLFDPAIQNIRRLMSVRDPENVIGFSFVVEPQNIEEIYLAGRLAKHLGCDNIRYSLAMTTMGDKLFEGHWDHAVDQLRKAQSLIDDQFAVFSFSNRIYDLARKHLSRFCMYHHLVGVIAPTGIYPCCRLKDDSAFNLGNIHDQSFTAIWRGDRRRRFVQQIAAGCPYDCWMTTKNDFASYLMLPKQRVAHVNYP